MRQVKFKVGDTLEKGAKTYFITEVRGNKAKYRLLTNGKVMREKWVLQQSLIDAQIKRKGYVHYHGAYKIEHTPKCIYVVINNVPELVRMKDNETVPEAKKRAILERIKDSNVIGVSSDTVYLKPKSWLSKLWYKLTH